ncbi:MAG: KpsF/GutQ family sugar-phosphate isomerase [Planctomycetaceae bacterium]
MSAVPHRDILPFTNFEQIREAQEILCCEADALREVSQRLDERFCRAVDLLLTCRGRVIVTGIGKAGLIGQKICATLSSTGTRSQFLHPAEAVHGDMGCVSGDDVVLALSNSGETEEVCRLLPRFAKVGAPTIAVTGSETNTLATNSQVTLCLGSLQEAGINRLAPSTSTTAMLGLGDALALVVARARRFTPEQFAVFHPGGSLGRRLSTVEEIMRRGDELRIAKQSSSVRDVFTRAARPGRRSGAVILVDDEGKVCGLFTDSDLARMLESRSDKQLDQPIRTVMTPHPTTVSPHVTLGDVVGILAGRKFSEIPVVDEFHQPIGLIDITDVIGLIPTVEEEAA